MINTQRIFKSDRACKALLGVSKDEFETLIPVFEQCLITWRWQVKPNRKRAMGGGQKGDLPTGADKLAFILMYLKIYPTYDVMSLLTDRERSKCCESVQQFLPVLEMALGRKLVLPERKITSVDEFLRKFPEAKDIFVDGSERRTQRPRNSKRQRKLYSGKKKATTRKNILVSDEHKKILILTPTKSGRRHDKRLVDKAQLIEHIPDKVTIWADTGFQGIQHKHSNLMMPAKARKKQPLTDDQKQNNRVISGLRIVVEHAIGGMKRFKTASDIYRNRLPNLDDQFMVVAAGLWNLHLQQTV